MPRRNLICIAALCASLGMAQAQTFNDLYSLHSSSGISSRLYRAAAFGDFNNDGYVDLAITEVGGLFVYQNSATNPGQFTKVIEYHGEYCDSRDNAPERQIAWADFDNDGDLDLFANSGGGGSSTWFFRNSGPPSFSLELVQVSGYCHSEGVLQRSNNAQGAGWFDVNRDGYLDLFNSSGGSRGKIHRNKFVDGNPPGDWFESIDHTTWCTRVYRDEDLSGVAIAGPSPNGSYSVTADVNNDGRQDIFYAVDNGGSGDSRARLMVWLNQTTKESSTFEFYEVGQLLLSTPYAEEQTCFQWSGVVAWDADNDGDLDVLYANSNGQCGGMVRDQFYENTFGFNTVPFSGSAFDDKLVHNTSVPFGANNDRRSGGVAYADVDNNGWLDLYVVHKGTPDSLYRHRGQSKVLDATTYDALQAPTTSNIANGVTFGDVDNDGDQDLFLCNGGYLYLNTTNSTNRPAHVDDKNYAPPSGAGAQEHYLDVMVSGASADSSGKTKDGIGSRVYLFHMIDENDREPSHYSESDLVGIREIDGGSGYGSQATQVQHFGLSTTMPNGTSVSKPHFEDYALKVVFLTGDTLWKWNVVPESVDVRILYDDKTDTTWLDQTIEVSLLDVWLDPIERIDITADPANAEIPAGDTVDFLGSVYTIDRNNQVVKNDYYSSLIEWSWRIVTGSDPNRAGITNQQDSTTQFWSTEAYTTYEVKAFLVNPKDANDVDSALMTVRVRPNAAHHLSIEASADTPSTQINLVNDNPLGELRLLSTQDHRDDLYAIQRDQYGNWVGPEPNTDWLSLDESVVTAQDGSLPSRGQGYVQRETIQPLSTTVRASSGTLTPGTVSVVLENVEYTELRISAAIPRNPIDSLIMRTDQDTLLLAEGKRSDNNEWEQVSVTWSTSGITVDSIPSQNTQDWRVEPTVSGTGTITISKGTAPNASIEVRFLPGLPRELTLYPEAGQPDVGTNQPVTSSLIQDTAGNTVELFAKIFDHNHEWLSEYETDATKSKSISWTVVDNQGTDRNAYLNLTDSNTVRFTPLDAHLTYTIVATFVDAQGNPYKDTARVYIHPGPPASLYIEASSSAGAYANEPNPAYATAPVTFSKTDTTKQVYAVLRDHYDNYIGPSSNTTWWIVPDSVATVSAGNADLGQATVKRVANSGSATLTARDDDHSLQGSATVQLQDVSYDSLRIVVLTGGQKTRITSLNIRTDQDTTLLAQGYNSAKLLWEDIPVAWSSPGLSISPSAPASADAWSKLSPNGRGTGTIQIELAGVTEAISVNALPGLPNGLEVYDAVGDPDSAQAYPDTVFEVAAGATLNLYAKIFDHLDYWLSEYETDAAKSGAVSWSVDVADAGSFTSKSGSKAVYVPTKAQTTVQITATYSGTDTSFSDVVRFAIIPGDPTQLVIEGSSSGDPNNAEPLSLVEITSTDTTKRAYAILRDEHGNYVGPSTATSWSSGADTLVTVGTGFANLGEGIIRRAGVEGNTEVTAVDDATGLRDAVPVTVYAYSIDSLRIVVEGASGQTDIDYLIMRTDMDTALYALGLRSDTKQWIPVNVRWESPDLAISPSAPGDASEWSFSPVTPDTGVINVSLGGKTDQVKAYFAAGLPDYVELYKNEGTPVETQKYQDARMQVRAGTKLPLVAKVFDKFDWWLKEYESTNADITALFEWKVIDPEGADRPTGTFSGDGYKAHYTPTVAFRDRVSIVVSFTPENAVSALRDTLLIETLAGEADHVVIEASADAKAVSPNANNPVDTVTITARDTITEAYLIVRDKYENYVGNSQITTWKSLKTAVATATKGSQAIGEGKIERNPAADSDYATITAADGQYTNLSKAVDSTVAKVVAYDYDSLRIMIGSAAPDSLTMTTNDDTTVTVMGLRSDNSTWEKVPAVWAVSDSVVVDPAAPVAQSWRFSPSVPASGFVRVYLDNDVTQPDTLWIDFDAGPPIKTTFTVLTPADSLVAGEPISTQVQVYNTNGLVPGTWCGSAVFSDILEADTDRGTPQVIVTTSTGALDTVSMNDAVELCFTDGSAEVSFVLYNAPFSQSPHQLGLALNDSLTDSTQPFVLRPGPLSAIVLESFDGTPLPDSIFMAHPDSSKVMFARGYDRFGNKRGDQRANWTTGGSLHSIEKSQGVSRIYYTAANVTDNEQGPIHATAVDTTGGAIADSVFVTIAGPLIALEQSLTRDLDGDGLLDAVVLTFGKKFTMPDDSLISDSIAVTHQGSGITFAVDSVVGVDSTFDSVYVAYFAEDTSTGPQTSWRPYVALSGIEGVATVPPQTHRTIDGAGPVIWEVTKSIKEAEDRTQDRIRVIFSERILSSSGTILPLETVPESLFYVYEKQADGTYDTIPGVFAGIENLAGVVSDSIVEFVMTNGNDLRSRQYLNIRGTDLITDKSGQANVPTEDNLKVRVRIVGPPPTKVTSFPNPTRPVFRRESPGTFRAVHEPRARQWALDDRSGTVLTMAVPVPDIGEPQQIEVFVKIYDMVGNLVHEAQNPDLVAGLARDGGSVQNVDLYWNGSNAKGMPVAPGVYRVVVYLDYASKKHEDARLQTNVGIGR